MLLTSARDHYRRQQRLTAAAVLAARRAPSPARLVQIVAAFQLLAARDSVSSVPLMLAEQGIPDEPVGAVATAALAGVASDGRTLDGLFAQASGPGSLDLMVATQIQDAARFAAGIATVARPNVTGYVRMLNPPSCSRCAVLAGRFYRWNQGFLRHPKCDCRHIPSTEALAHDLTTNPNDYFASLSGAEQDRLFTQSGAQAIRDGADISQVVNARRGGGVREAQVFGQNVKVTLEGTTSRGVAGKRLGALSKDGTSRYRRSQVPRLMPESIYAHATDRDDAIRLLRRFGYIL